MTPGSLLIAERIASFYDVTVPRVAGGTLADLGCGGRPIAVLYEPLVSAWCAIDWPLSIHDPEVDIYADLSRGIPLRSASMDTLVASDVLEHLEDPGSFLVDCRRIVRSGASLVGNVPFMYWLHEEPHDYFRYTEHGLRLLCERAGFSRVDIEVLGGGLDVIVDVVGKFVASVPRIGPSLARSGQRAWLALMARPRLRAAHRRVERVFPLAYGFVAHP